jgi:hypothetical protein
MSKYRAIYDAKGLLAEYQDEELVWVREDLGKANKAKHQIILDIEPYQSMVDGSMITSRSEHREHLRRHNCFEVGNEKMQNTPPPVVSNRREMLHRRLGDMSDSQANVILDQLRRN